MSDGYMCPGLSRWYESLSASPQDPAQPGMGHVLNKHLPKAKRMLVLTLHEIETIFRTGSVSCPFCSPTEAYPPSIQLVYETGWK